MRKSEHGWKVFVMKIFTLVVIDKLNKFRYVEEDEWVCGRVYHIKVNQREREQIGRNFQW